MGNLGLTELILMVPGCLVSLAMLTGSVYGLIAFVKVRKLEKRVAELEQKPR